MNACGPGLPNCALFLSNYKSLTVSVGYFLKAWSLYHVFDS